MTTHDRVRELYLTALGGGTVTPEQVVRACAASLPVDRAAVLVRLGDGALELAGASDDLVGRLGSLQVTTGDGPAWEALERGGPVLVEDTADLGADRWPLFRAAVGADLAGSLHALPLQEGAIVVGVLLLHRGTAGELVGSELSTLLEAASLTTTALLVSGGRQPTDGHDDAPGPGADAPWPRENPLTAEVHQATGMVLAQLDTTVTEAYLRLRAHAFSEGTSLGEVARAVVQGRLRFDPGQDPGTGGAAPPGPGPHDDDTTAL